MDRDRWEQINRVLERYWELEAADRAGFLDRECAGNADLRDDVEAVLRESDLKDDFLEPPRLPTDDGLPAVGDEIGDYRFLEKIWQSVGGAVFRAFQRSLSREVAIKVLSCRSPLEAEEKEAIVREGRIMAGLRHPGIVRVYAIEEREDSLWLIMDLVPGHDLSREIAALKNGKSEPGSIVRVLPPFASRGYVARVASLVAEAADALEHAHEKKVVHRDIKPHNLLLTPEGRVVWVDFGIARDARFGASDHEGIKGTPAYMSPEQARQLQRRDVNHLTDIYSLGVVLYELLTLRQPFRGKDVTETLDNVKRQAHAPIHRIARNVPMDLREVCHKAMACEPEDRYASAKELADDLRRFINHEGVIASRPTRFRRAVRFARRRVRVLAVGALVLGAVFLGVWFWALWTARRGWPIVGVQIVDASYKPLPEERGTAYLRVIDPFTGLAGEREPLGEVPLAAQVVRPGYYRVVVEIRGSTFLELLRHFELDGGRYELLAVRPTTEQQSAGMVANPGGRFQPALPPEFPLCPNAHRPLDIQPFLIDRNEVSNREYREFVVATGRPGPDVWAAADSWQSQWDSLPVVGVTWEDAVAYAEWRGKRLPSHPEWELAAQGLAGRRYPWGMDAPMRGNTTKPRLPIPKDLKAELAQYLQSVVPVDLPTDDITPDGIQHFMGNVSEMTETMEVEEPSSNPRVNERSRYAMGGAWDAQENDRDLTKHGNMGLSRADRSHSRGFRCARSIAP